MTDPSADQTVSGCTLSVRLRQDDPVPLDLDFTVGPGETLGLAGPSGSGKTTTLRAIAGLAAAKEGRIALGSDVWLDTEAGLSLRPERRRVGFVFQDYALFPHLDALSNVMLAMRDLEKAERCAAAEALLLRVGLRGKAGSYPHALSGGERQRVSFARALARRPKVLLLDEPFSAVDRPTRETLKQEMRDVLSELTVPAILVTHDVADVESLCANVLVIEGGREIASGPTRRVLATPRDPDVARVLGLGIA